MLCPNCNKELPDSATVCEFCDAKISKEQNKNELDSKEQKDVNLDYSDDSMQVILPDKNKKYFRKKVMSIVAGVLVVVILAVSLCLELVRLSKEKQEIEQDTESDWVSSQESTASADTQSDLTSEINPYDDISTMYIKRDKSEFYRTIKIHHEGEALLGIEYSYSTSVTSPESGKYNDLVEHYTNYFEEQNFDKRYISTKVALNSDEFKAMIIVYNLQTQEAQHYLGFLKIFDFYEIGMNYTQFVKKIQSTGYKIK